MAKHTIYFVGTTPHCTVTHDDWDQLEDIAAHFQYENGISLLAALSRCRESKVKKWPLESFRFWIDRAISRYRWHNNNPLERRQHENGD